MTAADFTPDSYANLVGYLTPIIERAAVDHPDDKGIADGLAAIKRFRQLQANPARRPLAEQLHPADDGRCVACRHEAEHRWDLGCDARNGFGQRCGCTHVAAGGAS